MTESANRIRYYRRKAGYTQEELSKLSGVGAKTIHLLEKSGKLPSSRVRASLADALEITEEELCGYDSVYTSCSIALPPEDGDYLVAYRIHPRSDYIFCVLHYSTKTQAWTSTNSTFVSSCHVKWWTDIPRLPMGA